MSKGISSFPSFLWGNIKKAPGLKIRPGQILTGTTLEVDAGRAVLILQGINVVAELETALMPGERVALQVEELAHGGKILLKKLNWGENRSEQRISGPELKTVLKHFGMQQGKLNEAIVAQMLRSRLPISGPHLQQLAASATLNNLSPEEVPALVWLWSKNLPLTGETVAAIHNIMENGPDSSSLQVFFDAFSETSGRGVEKADFRHLFKVWENLPLKSNDTPAMITDKIRFLIDKLGLNYEHALLQQIEAGESYNLRNASDVLSNILKNTLEHVLEDTSLENPLNGVVESSGKDSSKLAGDSAKYMPDNAEKSVSPHAKEDAPKDVSQHAVGNTPKDTLKNAAQYIIRNATENTLKDFAESSLIEKNIETSLKHALLKLTQSPEGKPTPALVEMARGMLEEITALQLLNISGQQEGTENSSIFLAAWASVPEEKLLPLFLKINRYNQRKNDAETPFYQIFFLLNTRHLGQVVCRLALEKEHLACGFTVKGREEKKLIDGYLGFLKQRLDDLPWRIVIHPTKVASTKEIKRSWQEEFFTSSPGHVKILDTRV